jgi:DNA-binding transcriptional LysR family regulator
VNQNPNILKTTLKGEAIFWEELVLVTGHGAPTLAELRLGEVKAFVLAQGCSYRDSLSEILERTGIRHDVSAIASFDAIRNLVEANAGVTLLPKEFLSTVWKDSSIIVHELPQGAALVETTFITRNDQSRSSALEAFLALSRLRSNNNG